MALYPPFKRGWILEVFVVFVVSKVFSLSLLTVVLIPCIVDVMKAQFEVDEVLWGKVRVAALLAGKDIGKLVTPLLEREFGGQGGFQGVSKKERKQPSKAPEVKDVVSVVESTKTPPVPVSPPKKAISEHVHEWEVRNGKTVCEVCGESPKD